MTFSVTYKQLYRVGSRPLESAIEDVKKLAERIWYKGYQPTWGELETLRAAMTHKEFQRSLCVLEMLSQYPVCRRDTALHLQQMTQRFHRELLGGGTIFLLKADTPLANAGV